MSPEEVDAFLYEQRTVQMATIGTGGSIHLVAMWYRIVDGAPCFETKAKSQKVRNLHRDNRMTCLIEDGNRYEELGGAQFVGSAEVSGDQNLLSQIGISMVGRRASTGSSKPSCTSASGSASTPTA